MQTIRPLSDKEIKVLRQDLKRLDKRKSFQIKFLVGWYPCSYCSVLSFTSDLDNYWIILINWDSCDLHFDRCMEFYANLIKQKKVHKNIDFVLEKQIK